MDTPTRPSRLPSIVRQPALSPRAATRPVPPELLVRASDGERNEAVECLGVHFSAGRLTPDEFGDRSAQAQIALTRAELVALFHDLPAPRPFTTQTLRMLGPMPPPLAARPAYRRSNSSDTAIMTVIMLIGLPLGLCTLFFVLVLVSSLVL